MNVSRNLKATAKKCATCGKGNCIRTARVGRVEEHDDFIIEIPAGMSLLECDACHEILMSPADMEALEPFVLKKAQPFNERES